MKKSGLLLAMASMMSAINDPYNITSREANAKGYTSLSDDEKMERKGLTQFYMGNGVYIWALNEKSAVKKYNKRYNTTK